MKERWKRVDGFPNYKVSNMGNVISLTRKNHKEKGVIMLKKDKSCGYYRVSFADNNILYRYSVHRLVAQAFIPNPLNKPYVNHKNGIKTKEISLFDFID